MNKYLEIITVIVIYDILTTWFDGVLEETLDSIGNMFESAIKESVTTKMKSEKAKEIIQKLSE